MGQKETMRNNNQTELFYKPMPKNIGDAAFLCLNRNETLNFKMSVPFNQLPLTNNHNDPLQCTIYDIWRRTTAIGTQYNATLYPMTSKFILLSDCKSITAISI